MFDRNNLHAQRMEFIETISQEFLLVKGYGVYAYLSTNEVMRVGGKIAMGDIVEGVTVKEEVDETTGLSHKVIIDYSVNMRPRISIKDEHGKATLKIPSTGNLARYLLPSGAHIIVDRSDIVYPGDILAKIPRETTKTKDITGGLPRVAELFEARKP